MSPDTDTSTTPAPDEAPAEDTVRDEVLESMRDRLVAELGDAVLDSEIGVGRSLWVRVTAEAWRTAGQVARDHLGCRWFDFLSAIDWLPSPYGRYEDDGMSPPKEVDPTIVTGVAGGDTRFQVFARVVDLSDGSGLILKADVPEDLTVPSWVPVYDGADWHERETWEMFGITFDGHPGLRHIYLPGDFEGNPLRKDFPLIARIVKPWPGIIDVEPMPAEDEGAADGDAPAETTEGGAE
ncbi:NADH-quinone oxidoreductase subunit C [Iamia sp. SCSIO 61187]|uniref:NADH-quinone oxidoreductase subunit C n=1 Tax=Iamia sp. SCSIO 61187 TaxID=2722752 RepID=UPI001C6300F6|nr:NADH-quinone oxidoreductase subunit C [Iamia sp. SCSIO 61187]QYG94803.1 NADH-quinone oxidoreductase subunit C [Iamia sp. SCSIO 61187]